MATELSPEEIDRLEWFLGTIEAKRLVGEGLTAREKALSDALSDVSASEALAREAFSGFYLEAPAEGAASLPGEVSTTIGRWVEARKKWDALLAEFLASPEDVAPTRPSKESVSPRVPRLRASLPTSLRVPTALSAREAMALLFSPATWEPTPDGEALTARAGETQVRLELDAVTGLGPEQAIHQIAKHGASVAQTFFALVNLWLERNPDASPETYMTVAASDVLRYQNRRETPKGGYHGEDILAKGRDIYLLSRITIPNASVMTFDGGRREARRLSLGRLLSLESLEIGQLRNADGSEGSHSMVRFRYHLGREVFNWMGGDAPQYARISGRLLTYHPVRQKYQILLGFCLAYYDRVNRKNRQAERRLSLPALLSLASLPIPERRIAQFLTVVEEALSDLSRDGIIPGVRLQKPTDWPAMYARRDTRSIIAGSVVIFPCLPASNALPWGVENERESGG